MAKLYLIPTPIGNLEDMTLRAIRVLKEVDFILAEDTRTSGNLLKHFGIETPVYSHHIHNEHKTVEGIVARLKEGATGALVSDAGTPAISDPGFLLVRACIANSIAVECLPGATAFVPALVMSGLPAQRFAFEGFLPDKKGRRQRLEELAEETRTMIFYVSPHKLAKTLDEFIHHFGENRQASLSREISKLHEETIRGSLKEVEQQVAARTLKGEMVLVVAGKERKQGIFLLYLGLSNPLIGWGTPVNVFERGQWAKTKQ